MCFFPRFADPLPAACPPVSGAFYLYNSEQTASRFFRPRFSRTRNFLNLQSLKPLNATTVASRDIASQINHRDVSTEMGVDHRRHSRTGMRAWDGVARCAIA
jgi:hypothetical protein